MDQGELDELLALSSSAASSSSSAAGRRQAAAKPRLKRGRGAIAPIVPVAAQGGGPRPGDSGEVLDLVAMLPNPAPVVAWQKGSVELMAHARAARAKQLEAQRQDEQSRKRKAAEVKLAIAQASAPASKLGRVSATPLPPIVRAQLCVKLAAQPRFKSAQFKRERSAQNIALSLVASCLESVTSSCWASLVSGDWLPKFSGDLRGERARPRRTIGFMFQWDETAQKFRSVLKHDSNGGRINFQGLTQQVMVMSGLMVQASMVGDRGADVIVEPFFAHPSVVAETSANYLLESVLSAVPFDLCDVPAMVRLCSSADVVILCFGVDRASSNGLALAWVAEQAAKCPPNLLVWSEFCLSHGCAITKSRAPLLKDLATALRSFTCWVKHARNVDALQPELKVVIKRSFEVRRTPPDVEFTRRGVAIALALWGGDESDCLWKFDKQKGCKVATQLKLDLDKFCEVASFSSEGPRWVHFCCVRPGSDEEKQGARVGSPCCASAEEALAKVTGVVATVATGRAWKTACESRWVNVTSSMRRFCFINANGGVLVEALKLVKTHWGLSGGVQATLARMLAADSNNFPARNKLRLLRIVTAFSTTSLGFMAIALITSSVVDQLLFSILGGPSHRRVKLGDLLHPFESPLLVCQERLLGLMLHFSSDEHLDEPAEAWELLAMLGGELRNPDCRLAARRALLQLSAGVTDVFELRMAKPPYTLLRALSHDVPAQAKDQAIADFMNELVECMPLFCRRLRSMFPSVAQLSAELGHILAAWSESFVSIDFSERSHAAFRHDLSSATRGAGFKAASDRSVVRQHVAEHIRRGGSDPASLTAAALLVDAGVDDAPVDRRLAKEHKGNPYLAFSNSRRMAWKAIMAPGRKMTSEETTVMENKIKREWAALSADLGHIALFAAADRQRRQADKARAILSQPIAELPFSGACSMSSDPKHLIDPSKLLPKLEDFTKSINANEVRTFAHAQQTRRAHVMGPVPDRCSTITSGYSLMNGCYCSKKNICREHRFEGLDGDRKADFERLVDLMRLWCNSLSSERSDGVTELISFVGSDSPSDPDKVIVVQLLVHAKRSPKMQIFADCVIMQDGLPSPRCAAYTDVYPFMVKIEETLGRLSCADDQGRGRHAVSMSTSDEVAFELVGVKRSWELVPLLYDIDVSSPSLLYMHVRGRGQPFVSSVAPRRAAVKNVGFQSLAQLDLGDPVVHGHAQAQVASSSSGHMVGSWAGAGGGDAGASHLDSLADCLANVPDDVIEDLGEAILEAHGINFPGDSMSPGVGETANQGEDGEVVEGDLIYAAACDEGEGQQGDEDGSAEELEEDARDGQLSAQDYVAFAVVNEEGRVSCPMEPFARFPCIGRLSCYPAGAPLNRQNVAMRCNLHDKCSVTRKRVRFTDAQMLRWLLAGVPITEENRAQAAELQKQHKIQAVVML